MFTSVKSRYRSYKVDVYVFHVILSFYVLLVFHVSMCEWRVIFILNTYVHTLYQDVDWHVIDDTVKKLNIVLFSEVDLQSRWQIWCAIYTASPLLWPFDLIASLVMVPITVRSSSCRSRHCSWHENAILIWTFCLSVCLFDTCTAWWQNERTCW